jgi:hypothetical protein
LTISGIYAGVQKNRTKALAKHLNVFLWAKAPFCFRIFSGINAGDSHNKTNYRFLNSFLMIC